MALKEQKFIHYSEQEKQKITEKYRSRISGSFLAKEYGIHIGTIKTWKSKVDYPEKISGLKRSRQKRKRFN